MAACWYSITLKQFKRTAAQCDWKQVGIWHLHQLVKKMPDLRNE